MKKYKLLQDYPLLPNTMKAGFEVEWNNPLNAYHHAPTLDVFTKSEVEKNPKFWEKVIIKEFKILFQIKDGYLFNEVIEGDGISVRLASVVGKDKIIKVKRLSDGEIFSFEDKIAPEPFVRDRKFTVIDKIYFNEHNQLSYSTKDGAAPKTFIFSKDTTHYKAPIFTTEDGVDMYEGDTIHVPQLDYTGKVTTQILSYKITSNARVDGSKIFSTKDAAWEYILFHMKTLSVKDVFEAWKESKSTYPISISFLENIKNLVDKRVKRCNDKLI